MTLSLLLSKNINKLVMCFNLPIIVCAVYLILNLFDQNGYVYKTHDFIPLYQFWVSSIVYMTKEKDMF